MHTAQEWLQKIRELPLPGNVRLMNVCGGHERSISMAGLRAALPEQIELIPGPGCPVCVWGLALGCSAGGRARFAFVRNRTFIKPYTWH